MAPHIKDTLHNDHHEPLSPTPVHDGLPKQCDRATGGSGVSTARPSRGTRSCRPSNRIGSTASSPPLSRDIEVAPRHQPRGKSVSFSPIVRFKPVKHINDYSDRDFFAIWYVQQDLDDIFDHCVETVRMMVRGDRLMEEDGFSVRGLEYKTPKGARARKESKANAMKIVLEEQERQARTGHEDRDLLARLYRDAAQDTRRVSRLVALKDEEAARPMVQSKSSLLLFRQKKARGGRQAEAMPSPDLLEQDFNSSATSVMDEFSQSWEKCLRQQHSPTKSVVRRVRFGEIPSHFQR
jgi:hypothetical protein